MLVRLSDAVLGKHVIHVAEAQRAFARLTWFSLACHPEPGRVSPVYAELPHAACGLAIRGPGDPALHLAQDRRRENLSSLLNGG
jgi:hypothetical protein